MPSSHDVDTPHELARSALYAPANSSLRFDAAVSAEPDVIIIDLEDGTPPDEKEVSRLTLARLVDRCVDRGITPGVRVNGAQTRWWEADLAAATDTAASFVLVPKADLHAATAARAALGGSSAELWVMAESVRSVLCLGELLDRVAVDAVVLGYGDLCKDLGVPIASGHPELEGLAAASVELAQRRDVAVFDGVVVDRRPDQVEAACRSTLHARFAGRTFYRPEHIAIWRTARSRS